MGCFFEGVVQVVLCCGWNLCDCYWANYW